MKNGETKLVHPPENSRQYLKYETMKPIRISKELIVRSESQSSIKKRRTTVMKRNASADCDLDVSLREDFINELF